MCYTYVHPKTIRFHSSIRMIAAIVVVHSLPEFVPLNPLLCSCRRKKRIINVPKPTEACTEQEHPTISLFWEQAMASRRLEV